jgi:RNA polymerase-interacting CarD/CdnL/TRCF family regulator
MPGDGHAGATLHDLRNEDKLKIGNLLRELARAQREGQQATRERSQYAERLNQMRSQNNLIVQVCGIVKERLDGCEAH